MLLQNITYFKYNRCNTVHQLPVITRIPLHILILLFSSAFELHHHPAIDGTTAKSNRPGNMHSFSYFLLHFSCTIMIMTLGAFNVYHPAVDGTTIWSNSFGTMFSFSYFLLHFSYTNSQPMMEQPPDQTDLETYTYPVFFCISATP